MKIGIALNISPELGSSDVETLQGHLRLGDLVEPLGFDSIFALEHHFTDYVISPCPTTLLAYFAGRTSRILLGTAVIVLPWHNPLQLAERLLLLDVLASGRTLYGFGRGRAPVEFAGLDIAPESAAERWAEALVIVRDALAGRSIGEGAPFLTKGLSLRPRPRCSEPPLFFAPATSAEGAARIRRAGLGLFVSTQCPWENLADIAACESESEDSSQVITFTSVAVAPSRNQAREMAIQYFEADLQRGAMHYAPLGSAPSQPSRRQVEDFADLQVVGTPSDCLEQLRELSKITRSDHLVLEISYGGMPLAMAEDNLRLASSMLPLLHGG